jgi:rubrerythrin
MSEDLTTVEIVGLAIRSEDEAAKFYGEISKRIKNALVRSKYESLAREEARHRQILTALYKKMTGENAPPPIPGEPRVAEGAGKLPDGKDMEALLRLAIDREREAQAFYEQMATKMQDANSSRLFKYLAGIERSHEVMLEAELEAYLADKNWYADNPDIQLV